MLGSEISQSELMTMVNRLGSGRLQVPGYNLQDRFLYFIFFKFFLCFFSLFFFCSLLLF